MEKPVMWNHLPQHILVNIFSYVSLPDRLACSLVCSDWNNAVQYQTLWSNFTFSFTEPGDERYFQYVILYGKYLSEMTLELDQSITENQRMACEFLESLSNLEKNRLESLTIKFTGSNPYFYGGSNIIGSLTKLLKATSLQKLDLSGLAIPVTDEILSELSSHHCELRHLNIQSVVYISRTTNEAMDKLTRRCSKIQFLYMFHCELSDNILENICKMPIVHLNLLCRREDKYVESVSGEAWSSLRQACPLLRVTLKFHHNCPLLCIARIMKPEIPVDELHVDTYTYIYSEVRQAAKQYKDTLNTLVLNTPISRNAQELNDAIIELVTACKNLRKIHIHCILKKSTIEKIFELHPHLKDSKDFTLKC